MNLEAEKFISISYLFCFVFRINDRVISANNISLEGVDYATAVQVLRDSGQSVNLVVKRRLVLPPSSANNTELNYTEMANNNNAKDVKVTLSKSNRKKDDFGIVLGCKIYIKEIGQMSLADKDCNLHEGDFVNSINGVSLEGMNLKEARKLLETVKEKLELVVSKNRDHIKSLSQANLSNSSLVEKAAPPHQESMKNNNNDLSKEDGKSI